MSRTFRVGLVVLGVLSALDLFTPLLTDGEHPPMAVALAGSVIGLVGLVLLVPAWRGSARAAVALIALRLLSAVTAVPAFFADGVPAVAVLAAAGGIAVTVVGVVLVLAGLRRAIPVGAR
jgi:hypothetical protein